MTRLNDRLRTAPEALVWRAVGLIASAGLILLWAGLKLTPKQIGA